jgi:uncharacterized membrane protein
MTLWAKQMTNWLRWMQVKTKIKIVFILIWKDEFIEKLLANYLLQEAKTNQ